MSFLFHTDNASLSLEQLLAKRDSNTRERLRLAEQFRRFEAAEGKCSSTDAFDRNDLIGQMISEGLLVVDDRTVLSPADRLYLAQRKYVDDELSYLIEMKSKKLWEQNPVSFHKSVECIKLDGDATTLCNYCNADVPVLHSGEVLQKTAIAEDEKEEGELSESEAAFFHEINNNLVAETNTDPIVQLASTSEEVPFYEQIPARVGSPAEPPSPPTNIVPVKVANRVLPISASAPTKTELGWQYYRRLESLSEEARTAEILEVRKRHFGAHDKQSLLVLMPRFDPTTDAGILITYGKLLPPNLMKISVDNMKLIEAGRKLVGMTPELPNRDKTIVAQNNKLLASAPKTGHVFAVSDAEVSEVKQRYLLHHKKDKMAEVMPVFDPSTDLGKLILWGEYIPPRAMQISALHVNLIQQARAARGLQPYLPHHQDSTSTSVPSAVSLAGAGSSFAHQLSSYQNANQYTVAMHDLECAVLKLSDPEINLVEKRYAKEYRGRTNHDIMPMFDPHSDLGKLVLAGRKSLGKKVVVPPEHAQLLETSLATVKQQRLRVQQLYQRVQELEGSVPAAQRIVIPPSWIALATDVRSCTAPSHKAIDQQMPIGGVKRKAHDIDVNASSGVTASKRPAVSQSTLTRTGASTEQPELRITVLCSAQQKNETRLIEPAEMPTRPVPAETGGQEIEVSRTLMHTVDRPLASTDTYVPLQQKRFDPNQEMAVHSSNSDCGDNDHFHSDLMSEEEKVRAEFERMKKMYEEWISQ